MEEVEDGIQEVSALEQNRVMMQWVNTDPTKDCQFVKLADIRLLCSYMYEGTLYAAPVAFMLRTSRKVQRPTVMAAAVPCVEHVSGPKEGKLFIASTNEAKEAKEDTVAPSVLTGYPFEVTEDSPKWAKAMRNAREAYCEALKKQGQNGALLLRDSIRPCPVGITKPSWYRFASSRTVLEPDTSSVELLRMLFPEASDDDILYRPVNVQRARNRMKDIDMSRIGVRIREGHLIPSSYVLYGGILVARADEFEELQQTIWTANMSVFKNDNIGETVLKETSACRTAATL